MLKGAWGAFGAGGPKGSAEWECLGATRWGRPNPKKLPGLRGGEREERGRSREVEGRLAEEERLGVVSLGEMVARRCRSTIASSSDGVGEGVGVGDGTSEG